MANQDFRFIGIVEIFDRPGGWYFISVPADLSEELKDLADRGLIPVRATIGSSSWDTSLLPMGDGTHFIALNSAVRRSENIDLGDRTALRFLPREP